jgi:hypothetical protein
MRPVETRSMSVESYLTTHADRIRCNGCGNCCPLSCAHKEQTSCGIHPKVIGTETRMQLCRQTPVFFFLNYGIACEPVLSEVHRLTGITPETTPTREPYPQPHRDLPGCLYVDPIDLARIRETRISMRSPSVFIPLVSIHPKANLLTVVTS